MVIIATSAPHPIIKPEDLTPGRQITIIDLAFPRDAEPEIAAIPGVNLFNLETVEAQIRKNITLRTEEIRKAEEIIREEITKLQDTLTRRKLYL